MKPRFAIFYPDRTVFDDGEDVEITFRVPRAWLTAPVDGVQVIVNIFDDHLTVYEGRDYYAILPNGELMATMDFSTQLRALGILKHGLWIPDEEFHAVRERVRKFRREWEAKKNG